MSISKIVAAAASGVGGAGLDVEDVFSTYLYEGTGSAQTINNGIDLDGEGGLVWIKKRNASKNHGLMDTEQGLDGSSNSRYLKSNTTDAQATGGLITAYNSNGFTTGTADMTNGSGEDYASWTFRKAPKFFDVVTWSGNDADGDRAFSHSLDSVPGMIIIKKISSDTSYMSWYVHHRSGPSGKFGKLNSTAAWDDDDGDAVYSGIFGETAPSSTQFYVSTQANQAQYSYIAYLFAHNNNDGEFGPDADQDIIKCGTYTTDGSANATIDLGFEPQWLLRKRSDGSQNWTIYDSMRGWTSGDDDALEPNTATAETTNGNQYNLTPTGFVAKEHSANRAYIYVAIRRGSLFTPEDADDVFSIDTWGGGPPAHETSGHVVDLALQKNVTGNSSWTVGDRQLGPKKIFTDQTQAEGNSSNSKFDYQNGWWNSSASLTNYTSYMWARAPGFFDLVHYLGNGVQGRNINHNLGVAPDMMWIKNRDATTDWAVYFSGLTHLSVFGSDPDSYGDNPVRLELNAVEQAQFSSSGVWDHTHPTDSVFRVGDTGATNGNNQQLVAYLFGSVSGVSKAGAFVHSTGTRTYVDCGFTAGARFVMYKYVNAQSQLGVNDPSNWHVFDTVRGIVGGIDSRLSINEVDSEITTGNDYIDPDNAGFSLPSSHPTGTYVFYAIA